MDNKLSSNTTNYLGVGLTFQTTSANTPKRIIYSESDVHYIYHILLSGLDKSNLDIEQVKEKNFLAIVITITSIVYADSYEIKEPLFPIKPLKIVKCLDEINLKEEILVSMNKGLLLIKIPKKYPIKRKKLKI